MIKCKKCKFAQLFSYCGRIKNEYHPFTGIEIDNLVGRETNAHGKCPHYVVWWKLGRPK